MYCQTSDGLAGYAWTAAPAIGVPVRTHESKPGVSEEAVPALFVSHAEAEQWRRTRMRDIPGLTPRTSLMSLPVLSRLARVLYMLSRRTCAEFVTVVGKPGVGKRTTCKWPVLQSPHSRTSHHSGRSPRECAQCVAESCRLHHARESNGTKKYGSRRHQLTVDASRMLPLPLVGRLASLLCFGLRLSTMAPGDLALEPFMPPACFFAMVEQRRRSGLAGRCGARAVLMERN